MEAAREVPAATPDPSIEAEEARVRRQLIRFTLTLVGGTLLAITILLALLFGVLPGLLGST